MTKTNGQIEVAGLNPTPNSDQTESAT